MLESVLVPNSQICLLKGGKVENDASSSYLPNPKEVN